MSYGVFAPAIPEKIKDIPLGEGVIYKNYGEDGEVVIGATQGGSSCEISREIRKVPIDGVYGAVKGHRRITTLIIKLTINLLKISYVTLAYGIAVTVSDGSDAEGTYKEITFDIDINDSDVLTNLTFKGWKLDGTYCIIKLENALNIDDINFEFTPKGELIAPLTYTGFYTYAAPTTPPCKIQEEISA